MYVGNRIRVESGTIRRGKGGGALIEVDGMSIVTVVYPGPLQTEDAPRSERRRGMTDVIESADDGVVVEDVIETVNLSEDRVTHDVSALKRNGEIENGRVSEAVAEVRD